MTIQDFLRDIGILPKPKPPAPVYRPMPAPIRVAVAVPPTPTVPVPDLPTSRGSLISGSSVHNANPPLDVRSQSRIVGPSPHPVPGIPVEASEGGSSSLVSSHEAKRRDRPSSIVGGR